MYLNGFLEFSFDVSICSWDRSCIVACMDQNGLKEVPTLSLGSLFKAEYKESPSGGHRKFVLLTMSSIVINIFGHEAQLPLISYELSEEGRDV